MVKVAISSMYSWTQDKKFKDKFLPMRVGGEIVSPGEISGYMVIHSSYVILVIVACKYLHLLNW